MMGREIPLTALVTLAAVSAGVAMGLSTHSIAIQREAVERGYALYCPTTGEWAWKGECEE